VRSPEVLVLHGSPGAGKSTLAEAITERLRQEDIPNALIDLDALSIVHPHPGPTFSRSNLQAVWPNYAAIPGVKVVLPLVVQNAADLAELRGITSADRLLVCELTAPRSTLEERVTAREPNDFWKQRLLFWVDVYHQRGDLETIRDFEVSTHERSVHDAAEEVIDRCCWRS
jgi:predicted kinase